MKNNQYILIKLIIKTTSLLCIFVFVSAIFFSLSPSEVHAAVQAIYTGSKPNYSLAPDQNVCGTQATTCWNSERAGVTDCGTTCNGGDAWTKYIYDACYLDPINTGDYLASYIEASDTCSTADKYSSGNPPIMNAGDCSCNVGGSYKTCCSGSTPVNASHGPIDPYDPDEAWCGNNSIVYCGQGGQPACGQDACSTLAPPPSIEPQPTSPATSIE